MSESFHQIQKRLSLTAAGPAGVRVRTQTGFFKRQQGITPTLTVAGFCLVAHFFFGELGGQSTARDRRKAP